ncbi:MAG: hypothetical protein ACPGR2_11665 [Psychrobium sp.]
MKTKIIDTQEYQFGRWEVLSYSLAESTIGTARQLITHKFIGNKPGKKVYIQAGLHAGEHPGILVLHELISIFQEACRQGTMVGEITIVPCANPIGLSQMIGGELLGRFDLADCTNFNRRFPDLSQYSDIGKQQSIDDIKSNIVAKLQARKVYGEAPQLKHQLLTLALTADIVIDLHCDTQSILHIYAPTAHTDKATELASLMQCDVVITGTDDHAQSFDDVINTFWSSMAPTAKSGEQTPFAMTVELRGRGDVEEALAKHDAIAIQRFIDAQNESYIKRDGEAFSPQYVRPLNALHQVNAESSGIVVYNVTPGTIVNEGQALGRIINPTIACRDASIQDIVAPVDGIIFSVHHAHMTQTGQVLFKISSNSQNENAEHGFLEQ